MKNSLRIWIGLLLVSSMLLAACQPAAQPTVVQEPAPVEGPAVEDTAAVEQPAAEEPSSEIVKGGTLIWHSVASVQFDPPFIVDGPSFNVASQIYSFLFRVTGDGTAIPDLAETWEYENDNKSVVFHLRKGVTFHDGNEVFAEGEGREVVASDVVYSLERYLTIEGGQPTSDLLANYESVEAVDDYTVRLNLTNPDALLFVNGRGLTSMGVLPKEAVEFYGETWTMHPIGSGPFELKEYIPDESVVLIPNEDHYILPNIDELIFKIIPDETVAAVALEAGEIHYISTSSTTIFDQFAANEAFDARIGSCPWNWYISLDYNSPVTAQFEVRKALAHALDGERVLKAVLGGLYVGGCGTAGPGVPGYDAELCEEYFSYDVELAEKTLTDADWAKNADGIWEKDGTPLAVRLEIWNLTPMPDIASALVTQLKDFGVDAELVQVEFGTWIDDFYGGNQKELMLSNGFCGDGGLNALWGSSGLFYTLGYTNEEAATMLDETNYMVDQDVRDATLREAQEKIYQDYPVLTLGFAAGGEILNAKVQDYQGTAWFLNLVTTANNVWLKP
ncbi:MAG TPA: ABC transporter substrate-binding protein [Anaerolineaceae bacterium]|nr:ABC transporter substrate-binding protein [Anaerolineaceae bacterium]